MYIIYKESGYRFIHRDGCNNNNFNTYLSGLFEGDGHIIISKKDNNYKNVEIAITFHEKDLNLCEHIKNKLGYGWIRMKKKEHACVLIFYTDKGIIKFVETVNGYLRTPKLYKFNLIIDYLNDKYSFNITKYDPDYSDLGNNNWLSGFIDADGSFQIRYSGPNAKKLRINCELRIEQRIIDPFSSLSYKRIFELIAKFFNRKLEITKHNVNKEYYMVITSNKNSLRIVLDYLNKYKLYSIKYLDYLNWVQASNLLLEGKAYLPENKKLIYNLKNSMNNKRTVFIWTHLRNL